MLNEELKRTNLKFSELFENNKEKQLVLSQNNIEKELTEEFYQELRKLSIQCFEIQSNCKFRCENSQKFQIIGKFK